MNSAVSLVEALSKLNKNPTSSNLVYLRVKQVEPELTFELDERLEITKEFYILSKFENWNYLWKKDRVLAFVFNNGQKFYLAERFDFHNEEEDE